MPEKYSSVRIGKKNINDLLPIFKSAFGIDADLTQLIDKFDTSYTGFEDIGFISYSPEGEPSAYYGVFPQFIMVGQKKVLAAQSGDTMTHKGHQGKGLFTKLANKTYELSKENDISAVFGFPSPASYPGFKKKLNWTFVGKIKRFDFFVFTFPIAYLAIKIPSFRSVYFRWYRFILSRYKKGMPFPGSILSENQDGVYRDELYWAYKLRNKDVSIIQIDGVNVVIKFGGKLGVGDLSLDKDTDIKPILRKLKWLCFFAFINRIAFYVSPETLLDKKLSLINSSEESLPIGFLSFKDDIDLKEIKFTYFDFDTF